MTTTAERLTKIEATLTRIERALQTHVPGTAERAHIAESTATADQVDTLSDALPLQGKQLDAIVLWMHDRMSGDQLQFSFDDLAFVTKQLASISEGWRGDLLAMRGEVRRLAGVCEQALRVRVEDDEAQRKAGPIGPHAPR